MHHCSMGAAAVECAGPPVLHTEANLHCRPTLVPPSPSSSSVSASASASSPAHAAVTPRHPGGSTSGVEAFAKAHVPVSNRGSCPYCLSPDGFHTQGVVANNLTVEVWLDLLNKGWRRFGRYLWCQAGDICCRQYPIRVNVTEHAPNRDNRKVWKRLEKCLRTGEQAGRPAQRASPPRGDVAGPAQQQQQHHHHQRQASRPDPPRPCLSCSRPMQKLFELPEGYANPSCDVCHEWVRDKLSEGFLHCSNCLLDAHVSCEFRSGFASQIIRSIREGSLWSYKGSKKIEVRVVAPSFSAEKFRLFLKYQQTVHSEGAGEVLKVLRIGGGDEGLSDEEMFRKYLIESPLYCEQGGTSFMGTFHFEYRMDDELFMTTVTDLLPDSMNSVYCFYDPDAKALAPGKLSILFEMEWMRKQQAYQAFAYYYLGMYLESPKMVYKASYHPAQLLCPSRSEWVPFDDLCARPE